MTLKDDFYASGGDYEYANRQREIRAERKRLLKELGVWAKGTQRRHGGSIYEFDGVGWCEVICKKCHKVIRDDTLAKIGMCGSCVGNGWRYA